MSPTPRGVVPRTTGLSAEQAQARLTADGPNALPPPARPSFASRVWRELREPMALLLLGAAAISGVLLGQAVEAVAILAIVLANAGIALAQEGRAERAMAALSELEAPEATVVRDGHRAVVPARTLVVEDLVVLRAGDRVPADLVVVGGEGMEVDESLLTGESLPAGKHPGGRTDDDAALGDRDGCLFSGTLVTRGAGEGVVVATGPATVLGSIAAQLRDTRREPTPLQRQLAALTRRLGIAAVGVAVVAFVLSVVVVRTMAVDEAFLTAVALAVAAVPEGMAAVTTVALALGVGRMAARGAIVRRLPAVETLGAADVLVIDKTGTVTENRMQVVAVVLPDGSHHPPAGVPAAAAATLAPVLALCSEATLDPPTGDATERACSVCSTPDEVARWRRAAPRLARRRRSPRTASAWPPCTRSAAGCTCWSRARPRWCCPGAPRAVDGAGAAADRCTTRTASAWRLSSRTPPTRATASSPWRPAPSTTSRSTRPAWRTTSTLVGLVVLRDPPRASAATSVAAVRSAGIRLLMATGDHPATAACHRRRGRASTRPGSLTGPRMRADGLPEDPTTVTVLARVDPDQKHTLVEALQARGHVVAMTGDGVNDAPALRRADIGVALGATGIRRGPRGRRRGGHRRRPGDHRRRRARGPHDPRQPAQGRRLPGRQQPVRGGGRRRHPAAPAEPRRAVVPAAAAVDQPAHRRPAGARARDRPGPRRDHVAAAAGPRRPPAGPRPPPAAGRTRGGAGSLGARPPSWWRTTCSASTPRPAAPCCSPPWSWPRPATRGSCARPAGTTGRLSPNRWLVRATGGSLVLQVLVVTVPWLTRVFGTVRLDLTGAMLVVVGGLLGPLLAGVLARRGS